MGSSTVVKEWQFTALAATILNRSIQSVYNPLEAAIGYQITSCLRRSHSVATLVLHVTDSDIDVATVQLGCRLVHVDQQLMTFTYEAELQVLQFLEGHYRCSRLIGDVRHDFVN